MTASYTKWVESKEKFYNTSESICPEISESHLTALLVL